MNKWAGESGLKNRVDPPGAWRDQVCKRDFNIFKKRRKTDE
ncbi:conserved hypothetical protein [delta proteobacterium NaphS2]|nr:conserved hypothetical protein [delta proteobacterium NaphS2]